MAKGEEYVIYGVLGIGALYVIYKSGALQNISTGIKDVGSGYGAGVENIGAGLGYGLSNIGAGFGLLGAGLGGGFNNIGAGFNNLASGVGQGVSNVGSGVKSIGEGLGTAGLNVQNSPIGDVSIGMGANAPKKDILSVTKAGNANAGGSRVWVPPAPMPATKITSAVKSIVSAPLSIVPKATSTAKTAITSIAKKTASVAVPMPAKVIYSGISSLLKKVAKR